MHLPHQKWSINRQESVRLSQFSGAAARSRDITVDDGSLPPLGAAPLRWDTNHPSTYPERYQLRLAPERNSKQCHGAGDTCSILGKHNLHR